MQGPRPLKQGYLTHRNTLLSHTYLSRFCTLLTSVPGRPLLRSADANKLLVPRSCTASFGLRSFGSGMTCRLCNLDLSLSDFRQLLKTALFQTVPVQLLRALVTVNLLIERFEMSVYYCYYVLQCRIWSSQVKGQERTYGDPPEKLDPRVLCLKVIEVIGTDTDQSVYIVGTYKQ